MDFCFDRMNAADFAARLTETRRDFHRYPESGWTEFRTTVKIIERLTELGLPVRYGAGIHSPAHMYGMPDAAVLAACAERAIAETGRADLIEKMLGGFTGCVTEITGAKPGPTVAIRVDIDCNDVDESSDPAHRPMTEGFRSQHPNLMHACGHDGHATIGLGVAELLCLYRDELCGKVVLIFQPAEEGLRGANSLTKAGNLEGVDYMLGAHLALKLREVGEVGVSSHGFLSSTKFDVSFKGRSAHAGNSPQDGHNAIAAASAAVLGMLSIARHGAGSSRINIGTFHGGTGRNVIPEKAELTVETRGLTAEINEYMAEQAERVCKAAADMYQCEYESRFMGSAGGAVCSPELVELAKKTLATVPGVTKLIDSVDFGAGEDITYMINEVQAHGGKATEMVIGTAFAAPHHNGRFDIDEAVLPLAVRIFCALALSLGKS